MLINILYINKVKLSILINKNIIDNPPIKDPISNLLIFAFLLSIIDTDISNMKSIIKFNIITKSKYIFTISPI